MIRSRQLARGISSLSSGIRALRILDTKGQNDRARVLPLLTSAYSRVAHADSCNNCRRARRYQRSYVGLRCASCATGTATHSEAHGHAATEYPKSNKGAPAAWASYRPPNVLARRGELSARRLSPGGRWDDRR